MHATATSAHPMHDDFLGHPKGVYVCFFTEMWERFSFYGMKALLLLYLTKYHLFGDGAGLDLLGAYGGLVYAIPVIGGVLADRWLGMRKAVVFGGVLLVLGHVGMAFEGKAATAFGAVVTRDEGALRITYLSLALIIMGVGFLKPNISTIVGKLYAANDPRRDSGFSLFYAGINLGALFASLVCGYIGEVSWLEVRVSVPPASACWSGWGCSCGGRNTCMAMPNPQRRRRCASACSASRANG